MLHRLIARNEDLRRLVNEGYEIGLSESNNHLLIKRVPYVTAKKEVAYGTLVAVLNLSGDVVNAPPDHVVKFIGEYPCDAEGREIKEIFNSSPAENIDKDLRVDRTFSARPSQPYTSYYAKMTTYVAMLEGHAVIIDPNAKARTHRPYSLSENESVFKYADTSSSRAGISALTDRLAIDRLAIIGLGGTGAYVLDFIAKTPVKEIHLYDRDQFSSHNAFRSPGAASMEALEKLPRKVDYYESLYSAMRRGIVAHNYNIDKSNLKELIAMDFVFLCLDTGAAKKAIIEALQEAGKAFIDVGMGIQAVDEHLVGVVRTTTSTPDKHDHVLKTIPFVDGDVNNEYAHNIQIAELNALNAALAVVKWKKLCGFYADEGKEHSSHFSITQNAMINEYTA
jgi:molybdopterin/thiamine biosynthesis adenylyltransferase